MKSGFRNRSSISKAVLLFREFCFFSQLSLGLFSFLSGINIRNPTGLALLFPEFSIWTYLFWIFWILDCRWGFQIQFSWFFFTAFLFWMTSLRFSLLRNEHPLDFFYLNLWNFIPIVIEYSNWKDWRRLNFIFFSIFWRVYKTEQI